MRAVLQTAALPAELHVHLKYYKATDYFKLWKEKKRRESKKRKIKKERRKFEKFSELFVSLVSRLDATNEILLSYLNRNLYFIFKTDSG